MDERRKKGKKKGKKKRKKKKIAKLWGEEGRRG